MIQQNNYFIIFKLNFNMITEVGNLKRMFLYPMWALWNLIIYTWSLRQSYEGMTNTRYRKETKLSVDLQRMEINA